MRKIDVHVFGNFLTTVDDERVIFPYAKVEALFYYLVVNKNATREQLANLLWPDMEEKTAKKNLRNALYTLKKHFPEMNVFSFKGLSVVSLNLHVHIESDYDAFLENGKNIEVYKGNFLQGFTVNDAYEFERWMYKVRDDCNYMYKNRLWNKVEEYKNTNNYLRLEKICKMIIELDEFDESGYIELMNCYKEQQKFLNAMAVYHELSDVLLNELDVVPNNEAQTAYNEIIDLLNEKGKIKTSQKFFFGRDKEIRFIKRNYDSFIQNEYNRSLLIRGEMGVGKTRLKEYFVSKISDKTVNIVEANCYKIEENYILKPWKAILVNLLKIINVDQIELPPSLIDILRNIAPEFESQKKEAMIRPGAANEENTLFQIEDVILEVLKILSYKKKLIIVFEDIHWMDAKSMQLLNSLLVNDELNHCVFLLTMRNELNQELQKFLAYIDIYAKVDVIELTPFDQYEVKRFIDRALPKEKITNALVQKIYHETEGNAFFLTEYIRAIINNQTDYIMSKRMKDVLKCRFIDLNHQEKKIVEIASLFYDEVSIAILRKFMDLDDLEIIEIAESLIEKGLLKEITYHHDICYAFAHQKLREFQYSQISNGKKKIMHNRIGKLLESDLQNNLRDLDTYYKLIYHFGNAGNDFDTLKYQIQRMSMFLNFIHVRFPVINFDKEAFSKLYLGEEDIEHNLENLIYLFEKVKNEDPSNKELPIFEMNVLYLNGRYNIRRGHYENGLRDIERLLKLSVKHDRIDFALKGYEQKLMHGIQICDLKEMEQVFTKSLPLITQSKDKCLKGVWLRYQGMHELLSGNIQESEDYFRKSIWSHTREAETFEQYRLNIAACYNNIGTVRQVRGNFAEALHYFEKAIAICNERNLWISVSLFKTNAGVACYHMGDFSQSKDYLQSALRIYSKLAYNMGQPIAEIYMCRVLLMENDYQSALTYLKAAEEHAQVLKNPEEWMEIIQVKEDIVNEMGTKKNLSHYFRTYLTDFNRSDFDGKKKIKEFPSVKISG